MYMNIIPLPKSIYTKAKEITDVIQLNWSGGHDEGMLEVDLIGVDYHAHEELYKEIETWAYDKFQYNGAGEGLDYGHNISYRLKDQTVECQYWSTEIVEYDPETTPIEIEE